ncbi:MAG: trypsin-like peptidase domain-containing protein [Chloroflexi bacterium]|nr:trypsin-like peptidase domain-containing protein [Chloroflexota bacterium]
MAEILTMPEVELALAQLAARLRVSVVEIRSAAGFGAGTIWRPDGIILTNHHVVPPDRVLVRFADGREALGGVIARDVSNDLAVVQVRGVGLPAAERREAATLRPGELVMAVGHPFGQRGAISLGIVTAACRPVGGRRLVQADVALAPGNSGGPLADTLGRVVAINAMVGGNLGLGVPSEFADVLVQAALRERAA